MRLYLGHKLPFGFFGGLSFGHYSHVVHKDGTHVKLHDATLGLRVAFWTGVMIFFLWAASLRAQSISPVAQEAKGPHTHGEITVTNQGIVPMAVVLEPVTLSSKGGKPAWLPLQGVSLKLSDQSARLGPRQTRAISLDATCQQLPCTFTVFAKFVVGHTAQGVAVAIHLPSTIYVCEKKKGCRESTLRSLGITP